MRPLSAIGPVFILFGFLTLPCAWCEEGRPALRPGADPNVVQWRAHSDFDDGRKFLSDGGLLLESRYVPGVTLPEVNVPQPGVQRLLESSTDREFGLSDLDRNGPGGHYIAPGSIQLNRKYVDLLRNAPMKTTLRFRAKGPSDPILILDGKMVVGVMMPMKSVSAAGAPAQ